MTGQELQRSYLVARLAPRRGESILDLGCGAGEDLEHILRLHRGVRVVGMDRTERMLQGARRRLSRYIKHESAELVVGDAGKALPFPSGCFDAVLSAELMECLPPVKRVRLLREIRRVLKPSGRILIEHTDWDTQVWNARDRGLERKLVHSFCDWTQGWMEVSDGWMGRKLLGLIRQSKLFKNLEVDTYVLTNDRYQPGAYGYARAQDLVTLARAMKGVRVEDARRFLRGLKAQDGAGTYFYSVTRYLVLAKAA